MPRKRLQFTQRICPTIDSPSDNRAKSLACIHLIRVRNAVVGHRHPLPSEGFTLGNTKVDRIYPRCISAFPLPLGSQSVMQSSAIWAMYYLVHTEVSDEVRGESGYFWNGKCGKW